MTPQSATPRGSFLQLRILIPFIVITLIWGSTWIVIKDQLGTVPGPWSVTYRFMIAACGMFVFAKLSGASLNIGARGHLLAALFGIPQFCLNFNFVYAAEMHVTSGLVAVVFALLLVPNSALSWLFLKHRLTARFLLGSFIACCGVALLFAQELRASPASAGEVLLGIGLTLLGVLSASVANVMQASEPLKRRPIASMLAWGMVYGILADAALATILHGAPVIETRIGYWIGLLYLGLVASAAAFTLYFRVIRAMGPGKAAYSSLIIPVIAMAISTVAEDYQWSLLAAAGGALALVGMLVALTAKKVSDPAVA